MTRWTKGLIGLAIFAAAWEAVARSGAVPAEYFPSVPTIARALLALFGSADFLGQLAATWWRTLVGLALALVIGLGLAIAGAWIGAFRRMLEPLVEILRSLPPPAIVPMAILALGLGAQLFLFIIVFAAIWTIYLNAANGLAATEPVQILTGRSLGYAPWEILLRLRLPAALPEIMTGVRIAIGIALLAAVASEMLAGENGLGFILYDAAFTLRTADMFAIMVVIGVSGILLNTLVALASRWLIGWHFGLAAAAERA
jgi:NitT/TauT family transport system permease protein